MRGIITNGGRSLEALNLASVFQSDFTSFTVYSCWFPDALLIIATREKNCATQSDSAIYGTPAITRNDLRVIIHMHPEVAAHTNIKFQKSQFFFIKIAKK